MYNNIEIDEWGLITLLDKMKELGYACVDTVKFFMKTVRGLVELVTDKVAWDTFNELDLFDVVEVWAVGGEMDESFGEDSSYDGEIDDSDSGSLDDLDYEINIDPNVETVLGCLCKGLWVYARRKSTTKKQGPTCSSASQVDPSSTQAAPVDPTSSQAPPVDQTSIEAPPVDQTSSPSDAQPAGMEDDISDQLLADLDIDAFVSNLIDESGIGSGQQQQQAPQVQWRFSMYTVGGRGSSGAQGPEEIEMHTNSTQPPTDGDEDTQAAMDDDNATKRPTPCHKAKKIKVSKSKNVVNGRKYGTRASFQRRHLCPGLHSPLPRPADESDEDGEAAAVDDRRPPTRTLPHDEAAANDKDDEAAIPASALPLLTNPTKLLPKRDPPPLSTRTRLRLRPC
nr:uncharacterized protein LOC109154045 [Ipomoea trifida]